MTKQTLAELYTMSDDKTGRLPLVLDIVVGMPLMLTKNHENPKTKIANGKLGHVVGIQLSSNSCFAATEYNVVIIHEYPVPPEMYMSKYVIATFL